MMVGRTYAQAIYELGKEENAVEILNTELKEVAALFTAEEDLQRLLYHPQISATEKKQMLKSLLQDQVNPLTWNTLQLIFDRKREKYLDEIVQELENVIREANQIVAAEVTTAVPLDKDQASALEEKIALMLNVENVELLPKIDPDLIGGIVVQIGNIVLDDSIKKHLELMKQESQAV